MLLQRLSGLIVSSNRRLPGALAILASQPDLEIIFGSLPCDIEGHRTLMFPRNERDRTERPWIKAWRIESSGSFWLQYSEGTEFVIDPSGSRAWCAWSEPLAFEDAAIYLLGPVLGFILRLRGVLCLHAAGIAIDDHAIAIVGASGSGKSTLAAFSAISGRAVMADDALPVVLRNGVWDADPSHSAVRLFGDSASVLFGSPDALAPTANWDKRSLDLAESGLPFQGDTLPLAAIYVLQERSGDPTSPAIRKIIARDAVMRLIPNSFGSYLLDREQRATEFSQIVGLVLQVPVYELRPRPNLSHLPELLDLIVQRHCAPVSSS